MADIIVGTKDCSKNDIWQILKKGVKVKAKLTDLANCLKISPEEIRTFQRDLFLSKISENDILMNIIEYWVAGEGSNAKLTELIRVVEDECGDTETAEKLRMFYA